MSHDKNKHQCTMNGLNHWFEAKFEKLGWMALAKEHGHDLIVRSYLQSISHLKECLKDKINAVHDVDRKDDLKIMLEHTETLSRAAHKLLDTKLGDSSKEKLHSGKNEHHDSTFYCLHKWETKMFEKLGWMVLSKNEGNSLKIKAYMDTIHRLKGMLTKKMNQVEENDRKDDLKILYDDICILCRAASKLLGKVDGMSSMSSKHMVVHSDEAEFGNKHMSRQSPKSMKKHNKPRHTRKDKYASKKKTKKNSNNNSFSSMMGGYF
jgi:hypothetical protein